MCKINGAEWGPIAATIVIQFTDKNHELLLFAQKCAPNVLISDSKWLEGNDFDDLPAIIKRRGRRCHRCRSCGRSAAFQRAHGSGRPCVHTDHELRQCWAAQRTGLHPRSPRRSRMGWPWWSGKWQLGARQLEPWRWLLGPPALVELVVVTTISPR